MRWATAGMAMLVLAAGCSDDATGPGDDSVAGTYVLVRINGLALPLEVFVEEDGDEACIGTATQGAITLREDNTFQASIQVSVSCLNQVTAEERTFNEDLASSGTYGRTSTTIDFTESDGDMFSGTLSGATLTITVPNDEGGIPLILEFQREG